MSFFYKYSGSNVKALSSKFYIREFSYEQYGGEGVGLNGGGARCGNYNGFQYKGIGVMPVVGDHGNLYHSNGMYPLYEAVVEAVCSQIYQHILPLGAVKYHAILDNGVSDHFYTVEEPERKQMGRMPLAIGVREIARRPAHYIRSGHYKPHPKYRLQVPSDVYRTRKINQQLRKEHGDNNAYIQFLGKFLAGCANQFAFAKVFRIAHGAVTPSNLSMDGRWLDLTNTTFVQGGDNYYAGNVQLCFLSEPAKITNFIKEMVWTYGKYNQVELNPAPLIKYYFELFNAYFCRYIANLFGLPQSAFTDKQNIYLNTLAAWFNHFIMRRFKPEGGLPRSEREGDIVVVLIEQTLQSVFNKNSSSSEIPDDVVMALTELYRSAITQSATPDGKLASYVICALRKLYFLPIFYLGRIYDASKNLVSSERYDDIQGFVNSYETTAHWIFDHQDKDDSVVLFKKAEFSILYDVSKRCYKVTDAGQGSNICLTTEQFMEYIGENKKSFILLEQDFSKWLLRIANLTQDVLDSFQSSCQEDANYKVVG